jgi:hypothetical protein
MGTNRLIILGVLISLLTLTLTDFTDASGKYKAKNFRGGANVFVAPEERVSNGLVAAGANVEVLGNVSGGLKAFGANVVIPGNVQGDLIVFGANVSLPGKFQNKVKGGGANVILSGTFDDDVEVAAARVTVTSTAVIKGNLIYSAAALDRQEGSRITGKLIPRKIEKREIEGWRRQAKRVLSWLGIIFLIVSIPGLIIVGLVINTLFPKQTGTIVASISENPWKNIGVGLVFLVLVPVGVVISCVTLVGIPAGIIAGLLYGIAIYMSRIYIAVWIGRKILGTMKKSLKDAFFWPLVAGTILIALVLFIPILGWLFRFFILLVSLGAMWGVIWKSIRTARPR